MTAIIEEDDDMFHEHEESNGVSLSQSSVESVHFISERNGVTAIDDYKVFNDPVHGHIMLHPLLVKIIDTPQFQRLRNIKQLGATYFVYPGASHNRFEHCIGTSHLAGKLARMLQKNQGYLNVTDEDILCVEMAGLCHDLGHGPFSHMFDVDFMQSARPGCHWTHEKGSCMLLDHLIEDNNLWPLMQRHKIRIKDITFVKEMIAGPPKKEDPGEWPYEGRGEDKSFLYEIISNERNKVDVDKWDYFARDCHYLGIHNSFDHNRFMHFIRVQQVAGEHLQICARDKECFNLYEMFHTRSVLHRRAYQHRVCKAIERMICDAMVLAESVIRIPGKDGILLKISQCVDDPVAYTKLNDCIFYRILYSIEPELQPARDILNRILKRQLYKCIGVIRPKSVKIDPKDIPNQIAGCDSSGQLKKQNIVASNKNVNYGMKDKNPIDSFKFFSKANPNKPYHMRKEEVSPMLPDVFEESEVQVFCTVDDDKMVQLASECFEKWCLKMHLQPKPASQDVGSLTPMKRPSMDNGRLMNATKAKKVL